MEFYHPHQSNENIQTKTEMEKVQKKYLILYTNGTRFHNWKNIRGNGVIKVQKRKIQRRCGLSGVGYVPALRKQNVTTL
jgi:hypothetical protein